MTKIILLFAFFLPLFAVGQRNTYEWGEGMMYYTGQFDTTRFTFEEIDTIYIYLHSMGGDLADRGIWKIEQMDTATTMAIDASYQRALEVFKHMKRPEGEFWDSLQEIRISELNERYLYNRLFILALKKPSVLLDYYNDSCANEIYALNGTEDELLDAWYWLIQRQKANNGSPENVERMYEAQLRSPKYLKYARLQLITYGWWNCMNQFIYYHDDYLRIEEEFQQLFVHVDVEESGPCGGDDD